MCTEHTEFILEVITNQFLENQKTLIKRQSCVSTWQEHTSLFLSWEAVSGSLKCNPCYSKFEEFAEYQTAEQFTLLDFCLVLLLPEKDIFSSSCPLPKYRSNPPALPENAQHISRFKCHSCNHSEGQRAAQISFQYPFQLFDNTRWAELQMKPVVQMKYELLLCPEKQVVYVWMWQREECYEISWVSVVREV